MPCSFFFYSFTSIVPISKISVSCLLLDLISFHVARTLPLTHYISSSAHCTFCDTCTHLYARHSTVLNIINIQGSAPYQCGWTTKGRINKWRYESFRIDMIFKQIFFLNKKSSISLEKWNENKKYCINHNNTTYLV